MKQRIQVREEGHLEDGRMGRGSTCVKKKSTGREGGRLEQAERKRLDRERWRLVYHCQTSEDYSRREKDIRERQTDSFQ